MVIRVLPGKVVMTVPTQVATPLSATLGAEGGAGLLMLSIVACNIYWIAMQMMVTEQQ